MQWNIFKKACRHLHNEVKRLKAAKIFLTSVPELRIGEEEIATLVQLTGSSEPKNKGVSFTASDLTDRLLPAALRQAYRERRVLKVRDLIEQAQVLEPTLPYGVS